MSQKEAEARGGRRLRARLRARLTRAQAWASLRGLPVPVRVWPGAEPSAWLVPAGPHDHPDPGDGNGGGGGDTGLCLPGGRYAGSVSVAASAQLRSLSLARVRGSVDAGGCLALRCWAVADAHVGGSLLLTGCVELSTLPAALQVGGRLDLRGCRALRQLPRSLRVGGDLELSGCPLLEALPEQLEVRGALDVWACPALGALPERLVAGGLALRGCHSLAHVPPRLRGDVILDDLPSLRRLPADLQVSGSLELRRLPRLRALPPGMRVEGGDLVVDQCRLLARLPEDLVVGGDLVLEACEALGSLPAALLAWPRRSDGKQGKHQVVVGADVGLSEATVMWLRGAEAEHVNVRLARDLVRSFRTSVLDLAAPRDAGTPAEREMAAAAADWLRESAIAAAEAKSARAARVIGYVNRDYSGARSTMQKQRQQQQLLLQQQLQLQQAEDAQVEAALAEQLARLTRGLAGLDRLQQRTVLAFLSRLREAREFAMSETRGLLATRVLEVLELLAGRPQGALSDVLRVAQEPAAAVPDDADGVSSDVDYVDHDDTDDDDDDDDDGGGGGGGGLSDGELSSLRAEVVQRMDDSLDACGDKPVWALNQMGLVVSIARARGHRGRLEALGWRVMRLMVVQEHAARYLHALRAASAAAAVDDVCVYLGFEIALREPLDLPVTATDMIFARVDPVPRERLLACKRDALAISGASFRAWLATWPEWQRQLRRELASELAWAELPPVAGRHSLARRASRRSGGLLNVMGEAMEDPVSLGGAGVWSLEDLLRHWTQAGVDLNNVPVGVEEMRARLCRVVWRL